jgi:hypothetical protein
VDWENVVEEIEALGRSEKRAIRSHLVILLQHLLKWQYQLDYRSRSWETLIYNARTDLEELLDDNPSLGGSFLDETLPKAYAKARVETHKETTIFLEKFPIDCPYSLSQVLDPNFLPD